MYYRSLYKPLCNISIRASHCDEPEGTVRLVNGPSSREGRVEVCLEGRRHIPCQETWGLEETRVVCRQLGFCQQGGLLK